MVLDFWCKSWEIDITNIEIFYDVKEDRIVFPIIHDGKMVDATGRSLGRNYPSGKGMEKITCLLYMVVVGWQ